MNLTRVQTLVRLVDEHLPKATSDPELWARWARLRSLVQPDRIQHASPAERQKIMQEAHDFSQTMLRLAEQDRRVTAENEIRYLSVAEIPA